MRNTKAAIESYIKRELRALQYVDIVTKWIDVTHLLKIVAIEDELTSGRKTGYTIAFCYYRRVDRPPRYEQLDEVDSYLRLMKIAAVFPPDLGLVTGGTNDLKELCERVVVKFDIGLLEPTRKRRKP